MRHLTWDEFDQAVCKIAADQDGRSFTGVYGFPRGGLCLAVALSHYLSLPLLHEIEPGCLVVDDIYETGRTLAPARQYDGVECVVWISKVQSTWFRAVEVIDSPDWIIFPWEDPRAAINDQEVYRASRE
jgi:hypoxanthine phosphoribosyltransferase